MHREIGFVAGIDAEGVDAQADDPAIHEHAGGLDAETGKLEVGGALGTDVAERTGLPPGPTGEHQRRAAGRNGTVLLLESNHVIGFDDRVRVGGSLPGDVDDDGRYHEVIDRDARGVGASGYEVLGRIEVCSRVLEGGEDTGVITVRVVGDRIDDLQGWGPGPQDGLSSEDVGQVDEPETTAQDCERGVTGGDHGAGSLGHPASS